MSSPIDGYFALAPWWRAYGELVPDNWAPEQWVHEALYESPGAIPANPIMPGMKSSFWQRRVRDDEESFRIFYSTPAEAWPFRHGNDDLCARRIILAPLNIRSAKVADATMPDLPPAMLADLTLVSELIRCYLPACDVCIKDLRELRVTDKRLSRPDAQGESRDGKRIRQLSSKALHGARKEIDDALDEKLRQSGRVRTASEEPFICFVIAPHLYPHESKSFAWVYSTHVDENDEDGDDSKLDPWVISTHQVERFAQPGREQSSELCKMLLYCVLLEAIRLDVCESHTCVMNNNDSVGEMAAIPLKLCPVCMRKLHIKGVVADVPACHARVCQFLRARGLDE